MHRLLLLLAIVALVASTYFYLPFRRQIAYSLQIAKDHPACCEVADILKVSGDFDESSNVAVYKGQPIDYPKTSLAEATLPFNTNVLGTTNAAGEEKWIEVSLSDQVLRAWEGSKKVMEFPISSGLWYPTPKGNFTIWYKTRYQRMTGGSKELGTFYDLPNVPHNMFFYMGYGLHGAYWHNNFGHPMSHGCVNEPLANAAQIFEWAGPVVPEGQNVIKASAENPGTRVYVH